MKLIIKKIWIVLFPILIFCGCIDFTKDHTSFEGRVIENNNISVDNLKLIFISERRKFPRSTIIRIDTVLLDHENNFEYTVNSEDEGINSIIISLVLDKNNNQGFEVVDYDLFDCPPYEDCLDFETGKKYEFDIYVTLPIND